MIKSHPSSGARVVSTWLFLIVFMVMAQATIGAITRLTESGLSIVEWKPVSGALPPLSEADWQAEFSKYKTSPQYKDINRGMTLAEFETIFWWEWIHRLWARLIGVVFALPLAFFWIRNMIPQGYKSRLLGLFALGAAQGVMGWIMVASGLVDNPAVSHYRLAAHLLLAMIIAALAAWWAVRLRAHPTELPKGLRVHGKATIGMLFLTIAYGAFVAGLDAGLIYNEFPNMGYGFIPPEAWDMAPIWINPFENHALVQFIHRWLGILTGVMALAFAARGIKKAPRSPAMLGVLVMALVQPALGIATLLSQVALSLGVLHQLGAMILLIALTWVLAESRSVPRSTD